MCLLDTIMIQFLRMCNWCGKLEKKTTEILFTSNIQNTFGLYMASSNAIFPPNHQYACTLCPVFTLRMLCLFQLNYLRGKKKTTRDTFHPRRRYEKLALIKSIMCAGRPTAHQRQYFDEFGSSFNQIKHNWLVVMNGASKIDSGIEFYTAQHFLIG